MDTKDQSIKDIVYHLQSKFGATEVLIKDHWDSDNFAIGLIDKTDKHLIYISTLSGNETFYVALEDPAVDNSFPYTPIANFDNVTTQELENILMTHFKIEQTGIDK